MTILDDIRTSCREVAQRARQVRIDDGRLAEYAGELAGEPLEELRMDPEAHLLGAGERTVAFILVLDAVNFGSGYFPSLKKRPGRSGYFTIAGALAERFRAGDDFSAAELARASAADCARIFGQDPAQPAAAELMGLFAESWRELGDRLLRHFGGSFGALVEAAGGSAARLVRLLAELPSFRDVHDYGGRRVPFFKRSQITAADLHIAFGGEGPGAFGDISRLTVFADNLLPHVLRTDGILDYQSDLAARIDRGEPLAAGSPEEVEIRACTVEAGERLVGELRRRGRLLHPIHLDNYLWHRGHQEPYQRSPRHRTRTRDY